MRLASGPLPKWTGQFHFGQPWSAMPTPIGVSSQPTPSTLQGTR
ncbi:MAG: hypothetical protein AVDCRST_MAG43-1547 [uncultured Thermomicrobiales bacterium]|uniref:Uncharacterized protein n=1 Tax=uncultured Thermomicrobiales bacterium TaxID=1645740 RepID=A0A6J4UUN5_9BACT|nr:MAG: hypothetical protein AVDCRST_MAG43-1547 [uncultured Thermomicrobiales bacterium]